MKRATLNTYGLEANGETERFTVLFQKNGKVYDLRIIFDSLGHELGRTTAKQEEKTAILVEVLRRAYINAEAEFISSQKRVFKALMEPYPSDDELRGEFKGTADAKEIKMLIKQFEE